MASQSKRETSKAAGTAAEPASEARTAEALKPFQEAARRFAEANNSAQESVIKRWGEAYLGLQDEARKVEQAAYEAVAERNKKYFNALGQEEKGSFEEVFASRARLQLEYENEVRQVFVDTQARLAALVQKAGEGDPSQQLADQRQEAYQAYLADLRKAWSQTSALDPQTISAIALTILSTINTC